jgi:hypothetical protein
MEPAPDSTGRGAAETATASASLASVANKPDKTARNDDKLEEVVKAFQLQIEAQQNQLLNQLQLLQSIVNVRADLNKDAQPKDPVGSTKSSIDDEGKELAAIANRVGKWLESRRPDALPQSIEGIGLDFLEECGERSSLWFSDQYPYMTEKNAIGMPGTLYQSFVSCSVLTLKSRF